MKRRSLLAGAGTALSVPLFGRLPAQSEPRDDENEGGHDPDELLTTQPETVRTELDVGSRAGVEAPDNDRPHGVSVWNATPDEASVEVRIVDEAAGRTVLELTSGLSADAAIEFTLLEPSTYRLDVRVPAMDADETIEVPRSQFDCNSSSTQVGIFEGGRIESTTFSTLVACADTTVTETPTE